MRWPPRNWEAPTTAAPRAIFTAIGAWLTVTFGAFLAGVIGNIALGVALLGVSALLGPKPQQSSNTPQAQFNVNQTAGPRLRGYGRAMLGGTRAFDDSYSGFLFQIFMAHHGRIDAFERWFIGDREVTLIPDSSGNVQENPFFRHVQLFSNLGDGDTTLRDVMIRNWPGLWTTEHRLFGIAHFLAVFTSPDPDYLQAIFPQGHETPMRALARLSPVWDPRDPAQDANDEATWTWSDTAALCILDYLRHPDGYRLTVEDIDVSSFVAKAAIDEQAVPRADGSFEKRYRLWGVYSLLDDPQDVLAKMRATSDAELYQTAAGKIAIRGGVWEAPTVTIAERDVLAHSMEQGNNMFAAFNELTILYTSPEHDFQTTEATPWVDLADQALRGVMASDLLLDMVPSPSQARRLAKIHRAKSNPDWKGTINTNLAGLRAMGERSIRLPLSELEIDDAFLIAGLSTQGDLSSVELGLISIGEKAYAWDPATEESDAPPAAQDTRPNLEYPVPQNVELSQAGAVITVAVDASDDPALVLEAEIRAGAGSLWQPMVTQPDHISAKFSPAVPTTSYQVRARWAGPEETVGPWTTPLADIVAI